MKIFLTSVAVIDDLAAIVIIALFYTSDLSLLSLGSAAVLMLGLFAVGRLPKFSGGRVHLSATVLGDGEDQQVGAVLKKLLEAAAKRSA